MKVASFQNYGVLKEINKEGIFKSKVRREWVEEKVGCDAINLLVEEFNKRKDVKIEKPIFGITRINLEVSPDALEDRIKSSSIVLDYDNLGVDDIAEITAKYSNLIDRLAGVGTLLSGMY